ncbi:FAD-dependent oxidoreductase [Clostridium sp. MSJ-8]|uniref:FAD-dependent oxidoreductase n=1 Tax=Clostridium sp. MSJ-8 TaxID=2841510 RepID=UPI001C0EB09E|nr:FAD-dependent oxidoreductase [Clostridium sp. MSJ-8]MBU5486789.1 FAD-dependent oxidoreductase [Clostridium sp. MSJ-8]
MDYDIIILGGGIAGCSIAYELSKYNFNIAVIERDSDIIDDISEVNASIIYDGSEAKEDTTALLEKEGIKLIKEACQKFYVRCKNVGLLRIATNDKEAKKIDYMYELAQDRKVEDVAIIEPNKIDNIDKALVNANIKKALYSKNVSVLNPYELAIAYGEVAADNGVNFRFDEEVINIERLNKGFNVTTNRKKFNCKVVIDTIYREEKDTVSNKWLTYLMIDNNVDYEFNSIVQYKINDEISIYNIPAVDDINIIGIKSNHKLDRDEAIEYCKNIIRDINEKNIINIFNEEYKDTMIIDYKNISSGYIKISGTNYSKMTLTPAFSKIISENIAKNLNAKKKKNFVDKRRELYRFKRMSDEEINDIIKVEPRYGNIVCVCNRVSEGEIIDCIRRPLGARSIEGIRKRTGAGLGCCYGSYCSRKIIKILASELNIKPTEVVQDNKNSKMWISRIKEFDEV